MPSSQRYIFCVWPRSSRAGRGIADWQGSRRNDSRCISVNGFETVQHRAVLATESQRDLSNSASVNVRCLPFTRHPVVLCENAFAVPVGLKESQILHTLNFKELAALDISYSSIASLIKKLLLGCNKGEAVSLPKLSHSTGAGNLFQAMMAVSDTPPYATVKAVGLSPDNSKRGLPHIGSTVTLFNATTGLPVALLDGSWITAVRTAAITLLAAQHLAPPKSRRIGLIGAGVQARSHLAAFREQFPIDEVMVFSRTEQSLSLIHI